MKPAVFPRPLVYEVLPGTCPAPAAVALPPEFSALQPVLATALGRALPVGQGTVTVTVDPALAAEEYDLTVAPEGIRAAAATQRGAYYALVTLGQLLAAVDALPACRIHDAPALPVRGMMLDISRGKVATLADLCALVDRLSRLKYNQFQLYIEGFSFAYPSYPQVWQDKMPLTPDEVKYLDAYCKARFIELVPNQNSLGHMMPWLARPEFAHLAESDHGMALMGMQMPCSTMDPHDPGSLQLVERMMDDLMPCFTSNWFNVNLDEPFELGTGKSKADAEARGVAAVYLDYTKALHKAVTARGKKMMMWGDILFKHPEAQKDLPQDIMVLDWGYEDITPFEAHAAVMEEQSRAFLCCPGTSTWTTLTGRTDNMLANIRNAADAAIRHRGQGVLLTEWGDNGHLEYEPLNDPAIAWNAACAWGRTDTTEEELAAYVNHFIYHDAAGQAAQFVLDLGRCNRYEEFFMLNMTIASLNMNCGLLPAGVFAQQLELIVSQLAQFTSEKDFEPILARCKNRHAFDYDGFCQHLSALRDTVNKLDLQGTDAALIRAEFENILRFVEVGFGVHQLNVAILSDAERTALAAKLSATAKQALRAHSTLWVARNRLCGMDGSTAAFARAIPQLDALAGAR